MRNGVVYVVGEQGNEWLAAFYCPCGCKAEIHLNMLCCDDRPTWSVSEDFRRRATLIPSVWRNIGCKSHFLVTNGRIRWC